LNAAIKESTLTEAHADTVAIYFDDIEWADELANLFDGTVCGVGWIDHDHIINDRAARYGIIMTHASG
jgi:hypothetical protein